MQDRGLRAEPVEDVRELERDVAAAHDQHAMWKFLQMKRLVRRDADLDARQVLRKMRLATGRDQDALRGELAAGLREAYGVRIDDFGAFLERRDSSPGEVRGVQTRQP